MDFNFRLYPKKHTEESDKLLHFRCDLEELHSQFSDPVEKLAADVSKRLPSAPRGIGGLCMIEMVRDVILFMKEHLNESPSQEMLDWVEFSRELYQDWMDADTLNLWSQKKDQQDGPTRERCDDLVERWCVHVNQVIDWASDWASPPEEEAPEEEAPEEEAPEEEAPEEEALEEEAIPYDKEFGFEIGAIPPSKFLQDGFAHGYIDIAPPFFQMLSSSFTCWESSLWRCLPRSWPGAFYNFICPPVIVEARELLRTLLWQFHPEHGTKVEFVRCFLWIHYIVFFLNEFKANTPLSQRAVLCGYREIQPLLVEWEAAGALGDLVSLAEGRLQVLCQSLLCRWEDSSKSRSARGRN